MTLIEHIRDEICEQPTKRSYIRAILERFANCLPVESSTAPHGLVMAEDPIAPPTALLIGVQVVFLDGWTE